MSTPKPTPPTIPEGVTKSCHVIKRPDFDGYGFNLHSEKTKPGQYIGKIDANSPAEAAGLKEGDRILEVNGVNIGNETHKQVVARIKAIECEVRLLLIDVNCQQLEQQPTANGSGSVKLEQQATTSSTKRASNASSLSGSVASGSASASGADVVDRALPNGSNSNKDFAHSYNNYNNNNNNNGNLKLLTTATATATTTTTTTPPPPSAMMASHATNGNGVSAITASPLAESFGRLSLPQTAAEMRAKLASRKKYDPKAEGVDLKKKYEIIQNL